MLMADKTRYVTVMFRGGDPTWFVLQAPPPGLPQATVRMKIGTRNYFVSATPPVVDAASGATLVFLQVLTHHALWGNSITPEGKAYEMAKIDRQDFEVDANWHEIESPFAGLAVVESSRVASVS
jgi:hypothetical protein